jgi:CheY-like chemotaxis protein
MSPAGPDRVDEDLPPPLRVLLVDDNADTVSSCRVFLKHRGLEVQTAPDGPYALEVARSLQPDVVLLDIDLPGMDG